MAILVCLAALFMNLAPHPEPPPAAGPDLSAPSGHRFEAP